MDAKLCYTLSMKGFLISILVLLITVNARGQQVIADSTRPADTSEQGFTNKAEAKNILKDSLKEGKWIENIDERGNVTPYKNYLYYRLTVYKAGKPLGIQHYYYEKNNKLAAIMPYTNGEKNGIGKLYYPSGKLLKEIPYKNDLMDGVAKTYYENGGVINEIPYVNGKEIGVGKLYYENGNLKSEAIYADGVRAGVMKVYYDDGALMSEVSYEGDKRSGIEKMYYRDGKLKSETPYADDTIAGRVKVYDENGKKIK